MSSAASEQNHNAGELNKAEPVGQMTLIPHRQASEVAQPSKQPLDLAAPRIVPEPATSTCDDCVCAARSCRSLAQPAAHPADHYRMLDPRSATPAFRKRNSKPAYGLGPLGSLGQSTGTCPEAPPWVRVACSECLRHSMKGKAPLQASSRTLLPPGSRTISGSPYLTGNTPSHLRWRHTLTPKTSWADARQYKSKCIGGSHGRDDGRPWRRTPSPTCSLL